FTLYSAGNPPAQGVASSTGSATLSLSAPFGLSAGTYAAVATSGTSTVGAVQTVTRPATALTLPTGSQAAGRAVPVSGKGFMPGESVSVGGFWATPVSAVADP